MNLNNFEVLINETILSRGKTYYENGSVTSLERDGDTWYAEVEGNDTYAVTADISESGDILNTECDCPYDYGEYCKHQVAVFYAIRNTPAEKKSRRNKKDLRSALLELGNNELVDVLMEYAGKNRTMKKELELRFSDSGDLFEKSRSLVKLSIKSASSGGFVEYGDTAQAVEGAEKVLNLIEGMMGKDPVVTPVKLVIMVLEEMMDLLNDCDDSDGDVGGVIENALNILGETVASAVGGLTAGLFDMITAHARSGTYDGWDSWQLNVLESCVPFCADQALRRELETVLDTYTEDRYSAHSAQKIKLRIISSYDGDAAAEAFMENHLENSDFRRELIERAIDRNQLDYALKLCLNGEDADAKYPGLVVEWREQAYTVYELMDDKPSQILLAREFILDGKFKYYQRFKALHAAGQWPDVLDKLLADIKNDRTGVYVDILIAEGLKPRILEFCRKYPSNLPRLSEHLVPDYVAEIRPIFKAFILEQANAASDRRGYQEICGIINIFRKSCGNDAADAVIINLLMLYKRRPAFLDELKKMGKSAIT